MFNLFKKPADAKVPEEKPPAPAAKETTPTQTVDSLAKNMCDRKAVHWANESAKMAGPPASEADQHAMNAAGAWIMDPNAQTKVAAQEAAMKAGHGGPGAWAAQAAAWSSHGESHKTVALNVGGKLAHQAIPAVEKQGMAKLGATLPKGAALGGAAPGGGSLAALAVAGAVALAAAMKAGVKLPALGGKMPAMSLEMAKKLPKPTAEDLAKMQEAHKPFIELGKKIAEDPSIKC